MSLQFKRHYTVEEARILLPAIRTWLAQLAQVRAELARAESELGSQMASGHDRGGALVEQHVRGQAELATVLDEFARREIQLRDPDRGLLDFPAMRDGWEVFLCWQADEAEIGFWHELDTGFAGREPL
ncbi:MAG: DUF2203 domain-containing protein [Verrucomicrobiota bacterium]|jgi:hypothetical protein